MNHVKVESAEEATDVVLGTFPINSHPATVLFDTGASYSFISSQFVHKYKIPTELMPASMRVKSPGGSMNTNVWCPSVSLKLRGVEFTARPIVLESEGLDLILGMSWLSKWKAE